MNRRLPPACSPKSQRERCTSPGLAANRLPLPWFFALPILSEKIQTTDLFLRFRLARSCFVNNP
jgi:hypothetical protein